MKGVTMAIIKIETSSAEQEEVLEAIKKLEGNTVSVPAIARETTISAHRVRYVIADLIEAKKIKRIPTKAYNAHYIRYKYEVITGG